MSNMTVRRALAIDIAMRFLGRPYIWGGDDPIQGFDCSGFVIEVLKSLEALPRNGDWTASMLHILFRQNEVDKGRGGCLVFWHNDKKQINHVEMCITDDLCIGSSGGGATSLTIKDAIAMNAFIKVRPILKKNLVGYFDPFLERQQENGISSG